MNVIISRTWFNWITHLLLQQSTSTPCSSSDDCGFYHRIGFSVSSWREKKKRKSWAGRKSFIWSVDSRNWITELGGKAKVENGDSWDSLKIDPKGSQSELTLSMSERCWNSIWFYQALELYQQNNDEMRAAFRKSSKWNVKLLTLSVSPTTLRRLRITLS